MRTGGLHIALVGCLRMQVLALLIDRIRGKVSLAIAALLAFKVGGI